MAYQLAWPKRMENGQLYRKGDIVDLSHYTAEQIAELLQYGQYVEVPDAKSKAKEVKTNG